MVWAGSPFGQRIEFSTGLPAGAVSFRLRDGMGITLSEGEVAPAEGAISHLLVIDGALNTCSLPLFEDRILSWNYLTADDLVSDRVAYRVERHLPFAVTTGGVRSKLGVEIHELKDGEVDLLSAYANFRSFFDDGLLDAISGAGDHAALLCVHAIEATAAMSALPTLQLKIAQRETSGTNEYQRFAGIDWGRIEDDLQRHIARAREAIDPTYSEGELAAFSFGTAARATDALTGDTL